MGPYTHTYTYSLTHIYIQTQIHIDNNKYVTLNSSGACKMAQQVKVFDTKPDNLNWIPVIHVRWKEVVF